MTLDPDRTRGKLGRSVKQAKSGALNAWLTQHGYDIPAYTKPVVAAYVADGFDFLALKLIPGEGVQSMQPVRVTSQGAAPSLPLHMVAVGTGPVTGITIWIVADGRWEPSNFPTFTIQSSELAWDWSTSSSNYETVRKSKEAALGGKGWQIESSLTLSQYTIQQTLLQNVAYDANDVGGYSATPDAGAPSDAGVDAPVADAGRDAALADAGTRDAALADGGKKDALADGGKKDALAGGGKKDALADAGKRAPVVPEAGDDDYPDSGDDSGEVYSPYGNVPAENEAIADLAVFFAGISQPNVRITRMRSDVAKAALSVDMALQASTDQSELSNQLTPTQEIGEPYCPVYNSSCVQTGTAPRSAVTATSSSHGCSTTEPRNELGTTLGFLLAFFGVSAVRARRRGRRGAR